MVDIGLPGLVGGFTKEIERAGRQKPRHTAAVLAVLNSKGLDPLSVFERDGMVDTPLAEPHGSMLAFLSDLHEQVEMAINDCRDDTLRRILVDLRCRIEAAGLLIKLAAGSSSAG
jgi:hypothetical protein